MAIPIYKVYTPYFVMSHRVPLSAAGTTGGTVYGTGCGTAFGTTFRSRCFSLDASIKVPQKHIKRKQKGFPPLKGKYLLVYMTMFSGYTLIVPLDSVYLVLGVDGGSSVCVSSTVVLPISAHLSIVTHTKTAVLTHATHL